MKVKRKAPSNLRLCRGSSFAKLAGSPRCLLPCSICAGGGKARSVDIDTTQPCMKGKKGHGVLRTSNLVSERQPRPQKLGVSDKPRNLCLPTVARHNLRGSERLWETLDEGAWKRLVPQAGIVGCFSPVDFSLLYSPL